MGKRHRHPELGQKGQASLYSFQLKNRQQVLREKFTWVLSGLGLGIAITAGVMAVSRVETHRIWPFLQPPQASPQTALKQGLEQGMKAAELTQSADLREDWIEVAMLWQAAMTYLKQVSPNSADHALAQQKIAEYQRNLTYAESNVTTRAAAQPHQKNYWTLGSDRELVLATQGSPDQIRQVSSSCYETLHYNNSIVELRNGYVTSYDNFDNNLRVLEVGETAFSTLDDERHWTLGSSQDKVIQLQGTPDRSNDFQSERFTTLYYDDSFVLLDQDRVIGYLNSNRNLKVSTQSLATATAPPPKQWSIGSTRTEVLQIQQSAPQAVSRNDDSCEEVFHFGNSEVHFRQGIVTGYRNVDGNLRFR